jgi:hypothetical protein
MTRRFSPNTSIAALCVPIGLASIPRGDYFVAVAGVALGISFVLFAPPCTRSRMVMGYVFTAIALLSLVAWLIVATNFPLRSP